MGKPSHPIFHTLGGSGSISHRQVQVYKGLKADKRRDTKDAQTLATKATVGSWGMEEAQSLSIRTEPFQDRGKSSALGKELTP